MEEPYLDSGAGSAARPRAWAARTRPPPGRCRRPSRKPRPHPL